MFQHTEPLLSLTLVASALEACGSKLIRLTVSISRAMGGRRMPGSRGGSWDKTVVSIRAKLRAELLKEVTEQLTDEITDRIDQEYAGLARQLGRRIMSLLYQRRRIRLQLLRLQQQQGNATPVLSKGVLGKTDLPRLMQTSSSSQTEPDSISRLVDQVNGLAEENIIFNRLRFVCKKCTKS